VIYFSPVKTEEAVHLPFLVIYFSPVKTKTEEAAHLPFLVIYSLAPLQAGLSSVL